MLAPLIRPHWRPARFLAVLALVPLLSGCVAAVAIPLVAGGTLYAREQGAFVRAATPAGPVGEGSTPLDPPAQVVLTDLAALPPPTPADLGGSSPWEPFIAYALAQGAALAETDRPQSALIVPDNLFTAPERRPCATRFPAVVLDLDKAKTAFSPEPGEQPPPGLAAGLARLREAGIVVLWLANLPASRVGEVAGVLRSSGLDPEGKDQFLLIRDGGDRKQALREDAGKDVCIVAIAGDQRADFDELFDYLRDPDSAARLDGMLGDGWFLVPPPLEAVTP